MSAQPRRPPTMAGLQRGLRPGHAVRLLFDAHEAWLALRHHIDNAHLSIDIQLYMLDPDEAGEAFVAALERACQRGVAVRLVLDGVGSSDFNGPLVGRLVQAGVALRVFGPLHRAVPWRRWLRRNHRKVFVFDGKSAIVAGRNVGNRYLALAAGQPTWIDAGLWLEGPAVRVLAGVLHGDWQGPYLRGGRRRRVWSKMAVWLHAHLVQAELASASLGHAPFPLRVRERSVTRARTPGVRLAAALNLGGPSEAQANLRYLQAIRAARRTVTLAQSYFLPDAALLRALLAAARRGVSVRLLLPDPATSDVRLAALATQHGLGRLLAGGVQVSLATGPMMHAKAGVVDGVWWTIGSANLDPLSRRNNLEANIVGFGRNEASQVEEAIAGWSRQARPLTLQQHAARPLWQRWLGRLLWRLRGLF